MVIRAIFMILSLTLAAKILYSIPVLIIVGLIVKSIMKSTPQYDRKSTLNKYVICLVELMTLIMFLKFGFTLTLIKFVIFMLIATFGSICDIKERKMETYISIMALLTGFIGTNISSICINAIAMLIAFIFMLICGMISKGHIGGADIKFIPACFFVLGFTRGVSGLILAFVMAIIGTFIRNKISKTSDLKEKQTLPLIPYLSAAYVLTSMI